MNGESFFNTKHWDGFEITTVGVVIITLILLLGSLTNIERLGFVQKVVIYVLGTGIIGYAHNLAFATQRSWQGENFLSLSPWAQASAIGAHIVWFGLFIAAVAML